MEMFKYDEEFQDDDSKYLEEFQDPSECHCVDCLPIKPGLIMWLLQGHRRVRYTGLECCGSSHMPSLPYHYASPPLR